MARRSSGEGTVIETSNGRWAAVIELPRSGNGKRQRRWRRARTKAEAQRLLREMRDELAQTGAIADSQRTVDHAVADYRQVRWSTEGLSRGTLEHDSGPLKLIESGLGPRRLSSLGVADCDRFLRKATEGDFGQPLGKGYVGRLRRTLINVLQNELRLGSIPRNVAELSITPTSSKPRKQRRALTHEELQRLLDVATDGRLVIIELCGRYGLRPAEARALRWQDVDLDAAELTVSGQLNRHNERTAPKTRNAGRTIEIDGQTIDRLKAWRSAQSKLRANAQTAWAEQHLLATTTLGSPIDRHSLARSLRLYCSKTGIDPAVSPYELRHTAISMQADAGYSSWEIADWAGTSETMIADVYRHRIRRVSNLPPVQ